MIAKSKCESGECRTCKKGSRNYDMRYLESFVEFFRWYEVGFWLLSFGVCMYFWGAWGIIIASLLDFLNHLSGGPVADVFGTYKREEPKITYKECHLGHKNCKYTAKYG